MKKITFLCMLLISTIAFAQPTDNATDPPARDAVDVISIFSDTYANVPGSDYNPNWGQAGFGTANTAFDPGTGNVVLAYPNFNYQGNQFGSTQNISAMEFLHVDIWITGTFNPNVFVISSGGEIAHPITNTGAGSWISVDIPVAGITGDTSAAIQFKFDGGNGSSDAIYVDNLYFWKNPTAAGSDATLSDLQIDGATITGFGPGTTSYSVELAPGTTVVPQITTATATDPAATSVNITQASAIPGDATVVVTSQNGMVMETYTVSFAISGPATAAPTPPNRAAADVVSIYSDTYSNIAVSTYDAGWCGVAVSEVAIGGNNMFKKNTGVPCQGIDFSANRQNLTDFTHIHFDFYTDDVDLVGDVFNVKLVDFAGGGGEASALEVNINTGTMPAIVAGTWVSVDVDITALGGVVANNLTRSDIAQIGITTANLTNVWYDNIYLHKNTVLSTEEFNAASFKTYPNPTKDSWNVVTDNTIINSVQVFDISGRQVMTLAPSATEVSIDGSKLQKGIYFARVSTDKGTSSVKLVKN